MGQAQRRKQALLAALRDTVGQQPIEIRARKAAQRLCDAQHLCVIGEWEKASGHRALFALMGAYFGEQLEFTIVEPAYHPELSRAVIETEPPLLAAQRIYPELFIAFVSDSPGNRKLVDGLIRQTSGNIGQLRLEYFAEKGPVIVLDSGRIEQAAVLMLNSLKQMHEGSAIDLTCISRNSAGVPPGVAVASNVIANRIGVREYAIGCITFDLATGREVF